MRQLFPDHLDVVHPYDAYRPADPHGRVLRVNMIATADGLATDREGRTGGLAGDGDREVFRTLRALADCVLVGAGTVRAEAYGPHRVRADLWERRRADGRQKPAAIVVVSGSLDLDYSAPLFGEAVTRTIVVTHASADAERVAIARKHAEVLVAGEQRVDLARAVRTLREDHGYAHILSEGGPRLNDELFALGLVDELCLTYAPVLLGFEAPRILGSLHEAIWMELVALLEDDSELFARYRLLGARRE